MIRLIFALGTPLPANVKPWKYFDVDAVMVSAYYILNNGSIKKQVLSKGMKDYLDFDGMVVLDSGVFQLINKGKDVDYNEIMDLYRQIDGVDIKLSFDYPDDRIIEQYLKFRKYDVEPVIPANQSNILPFFEHENCEWIFVGRLAKELIQKGWRGFNFVQKSTELFSEKSDKKLWALGVGNYNTLPFLRQANFDGSDTSSYRVAAAYGDIIVPGKGTRHVTGKKNNKKYWKIKNVVKKDIELILKNIDFSFNDIETNFQKRAIFNAYSLINLSND